MFSSFFPSPKYFFISSSAWILTLIIVWYTLGESIGTFLGFNLKESQTVIGLGHFITPNFCGSTHIFYLVQAQFTYFGTLKRNTHLVKLVYTGISVTNLSVVYIGTGLRKLTLGTDHFMTIFKMH